MAGFWNRLISGKDRAVFEAEKLRQVTALQTQIRKLQGEIEQSFATLGAATYRLHRENQIQHPELQRACNAIRSLQLQIEQREQDIQTLHRQEFEGASASSLICPNGHGELPSQNRFCNTCGEEGIRPTVGNQCSSCGAPIPIAAQFCVECGAPATAAAPPRSFLEPAKSAYRPPTPAASGASQPPTDDITSGSHNAAMARRCPNCGAAAQPDTHWCIYCGAALDDAATGPVQSTNPAPDPGTRLLPETEAVQSDAQTATQSGGRATTLLPETELEQSAEATTAPAATQSGIHATTLLPETELEQSAEATTAPAATQSGSHATTLLPETELEQQVVQNRACPSCGNPLVEGAAFCTHCGQVVSS